jgi:hypothetical protein
VKRKVSPEEAMDKGTLHAFMDKKWGFSALGMKEKYDWLFSITGKDHVAHLTHEETIKAISRFPTAHGVPPVRGSIWAQLKKERKERKSKTT